MTATPPTNSGTRWKFKPSLELLSLILALYALFYEVTSTKYILNRDAAVSERASIESMLSADRLDLTLRGFGPAQNRKVPSMPPRIDWPVGWFFFDEVTPFKKQLHDEIESALKQHSREYATGTRGPDAPGSNLQDADLSHVVLRRANLSHSCMRRADLQTSDLSQSTFGGADLTYADITGAQFIEAKLYEANLSHTKAANVNFSGAFLDNASFNSSDLSRATFADVSLQCVDLSNADLTAINSWRSIATFQDSNIHGARNMPEGFADFAKHRHAVDLDSEDWNNYRKEYCSTPAVAEKVNQPCGTE